MEWWEAVKRMQVWEDIDDTATDVVETVDDWYEDLTDWEF